MSQFFKISLMTLFWMLSHSALADNSATEAASVGYGFPSPPGACACNLSQRPLVESRDWSYLAQEGSPGTAPSTSPSTGGTGVDSSTSNPPGK